MMEFVHRRTGGTPRRGGAPRVALFVVLLGVSVALVVGRVGPAAAGAGRSIVFPQISDEGVLIYAQQCAPCHGGEGEGDSGPSLKTSALDDEERLTLITDGRDAMPAFGATLSDEQLVSINEFVGLLSQHAGSAIFAEQCAPCHGADGTGGIGPDLTASTLPTSDRLTLITKGRGAMPGFGATLGGGDLEAVAAFAAALGAAPTQTTVPAPRTGSEAYGQHCSSCHGPDGSGGIGPALRDTGLSAGDLTSIISSGRGSMPAFGSSLAADEIAGVVSYIGTLDAAPTPPDPARVAAGAEIFAQRCTECHGGNASGGIGPSLRQLTASRDDIISVVFNGRRQMPAFGGLLSEEQIEDVADFLQVLTGEVSTAPTVDVESGEAVFADRCVECHGADGSGGIGPSLWKSKLSVNEIVSRVYGGHMADMPAFREALTATEVQAVSRYTKGLQTGQADDSSFLEIALIVLGIVVVAGAGLGWLRVRRKRTPS